MYLGLKIIYGADKPRIRILGVYNGNHFVSLGYNGVASTCPN
jgi:hypothetical protein